jgi:hypothetical protein
MRTGFECIHHEAVALIELPQAMIGYVPCPLQLPLQIHLVFSTPGNSGDRLLIRQVRLLQLHFMLPQLAVSWNGCSIAGCRPDFYT